MRFGDPVLPERFWEKVRPGDSGCWDWIAATSDRGYGHILWDGKVVLAHRLVLLVGDGIPPGLVVDHLCRNRACVNPDHLEPVTTRTNLLRGDTITARNAAVTHCPWGHEYDEANTYYGKGGRRCRACHRERARTSQQERIDCHG